ncbi:hypothetical protein Gotur_002833 [Gossypium turneri]
MELAISNGSEEQRTSTSRGRNNQQRNKEPAPVEDQ